VVIGVLTLELSIDSAHSLKEKRAVLNRVKDRVQHRFNVAIAEVDDHDLWNCACLAVVTVSTQREHCNRVLSKVADQVRTIKDCELEDFSVEFL
jgi:uncharacterized protein YlxP (DUF503 family)